MNQPRYTCRSSLRSYAASTLRACAEKDGRGYPDWAMRYLPVVREWRGRDLAAQPVLEIGANANGFARFARMRVVAVDLSMAHLREARASQTVWPVAADIAALPFRDGSIGTYVCMDTLEHVAPGTRTAAMKELARVLAEEGRAVAGFPAGLRAARAEEGIREAYRRYAGGALRWFEEHATNPLPDPCELKEILAASLGGSHRVKQTGNANIWVWSWMWRVLICGWPGRGNALFQCLLRWSTPLLSRCHFPPCYRCLLWIEPRTGKRLS